MSGNSALDSLVTQADQNGNQVIPSSSASNATSSGDAKAPAKKKSILASVCSCLSPKSQSTEKQRGSKSEASNSGNTVVQGPATIPDAPEPPQLGPQAGKRIGQKTLVLDLDETLVHSSFRPIDDADIIITVEIEGENHFVYVRKRPYVDEFLARLAPIYELVVYTASVAKYANPLMDKLDPKGCCIYRLFREACTKSPGGYVKDLSKLGRDLTKVCIIDNSPVCYSLQPENAIPIKTWRFDPTDRELDDLIPILIALADVDDIPAVLKQTLHCQDDEEDMGLVI
jgi:RNA polymerase II subunit A small phosphatase-like protein